MMLVFRVMTAACLLSLLLRQVDAQSLDASTVYEPDVREVLNSVLKERARLKSWRFQAVVTRKDDRWNQSTRSALLSIYDHASRRMRLETEGDARSVLTSNLEPPCDPSDLDRTPESLARLRRHSCRSFIVDQHDYRVEWYGIGNTQSPDAETTHAHLLNNLETPPYRCSPAIDPRSAGVLDQTSPTLLASLESCLVHFNDGAELATLDRSDAPQLRIVFDYSIPVRRVIHIDQERGYTITRCDTIVLTDDRSELVTPRTTSAAEWEQSDLPDGPWVPTRASWADVDRNGSVRRTSYAFQWQEVNPQSFDDNLFDDRINEEYGNDQILLDSHTASVTEPEEPFIAGAFSTPQPAVATNPAVVPSQDPWLWAMNLAVLLGVITMLTPRL
ncbi:hypothetical protein [Schlesneria sp.]|uniref:hypothetical protein n=1 Tax=Schlesneria sp. TaxID=2762018 RepID=UPI002EEB17BF